MSILIDENTTFIIQGITARERVDGSVLTVPPAFVRDAAFEAIENGIKLVVIVTERTPRGEVAQIVEFAGVHGARLIGPNCLGVIAPGKAKMGGLGGPAEDARKAYTPGAVGVMSRSGGMTTEISNALTAAGLGQSTAVSIGGDAIIGSTYAELMPLFEADPETKAIVVFMAGRFMDAMPGMRFGHAGTIVEGKQDTAAEKVRRLTEAGIRVAEEIADIPALVKQALAEAA